jgi:hypothetical protein
MVEFNSQVWVMNIFKDINDIMKHHIDNNQRYDSDVCKMTNLEWGQVKIFMGDMIKTTTSLEHVTVKVEKYVQHTKDMREILSAPMDHQSLPLHAHV